MRKSPTYEVAAVINAIRSDPIGPSLPLCAGHSPYHHYAPLTPSPTMSPLYQEVPLAVVPTQVHASPPPLPDTLRASQVPVAAPRQQRKQIPSNTAFWARASEAPERIPQANDPTPCLNGIAIAELASPSVKQAWPRHGKGDSSNLRINGYMLSVPTRIGLIKSRMSAFYHSRIQSKELQQVRQLVLCYQMLS
jgi:hypothetical protein